MELTLAGYSNNLLNLIIRPAGRSRSFKWLGRGDINNIPYNIPRPIFIPRWIPKERPEYVAKWVPTTPAPQSNKQSPIQSGFGAPKTNSVVQMQKLPPTSDVAPPLAAAIAPTPAHVSLPVPVQSPAPVPSDFAPPNVDDIISTNNILPSTVGVLPLDPIITEQPLPQNVIPETAIRNVVSEAIEFPGEPSFSALIQDEQEVDLNGFRSVDPNSIIIIDEGNSDGTGKNLVHSEPSTIFSPAEQDTLILTDVTELTPTELSLDQTSVHEGSDLLFIVDPDSTLSPLTTTLLLEERETFQSLRDNVAINTQTLDPIQSNIVNQPQLETLFNEDIPQQIPQSDIATKLNQDIVTPDDTIFITEDIPSNEDIQFNQELQFDQNFQFNDNSDFNEVQLNQVFESGITPQFIQEPQFNQDFQSNDFVSQLNQEQIQQDFQPNDFVPQLNQDQFQQNIQSNENDEIFVVSDEGIQFNENFLPDQEAQFSNFQIGQTIQFRPLPIQQHDTTGPLIPSLPRPALVAPPVSPILPASRSFDTSRSDTIGHASPSGRSFSTDVAIPQPVPIPIGPLASLTLDFPLENAGVRQARVASGALPFGARLHPRRTRHFHSRPLFYGK